MKCGKVIQKKKRLPVNSGFGLLEMVIAAGLFAVLSLGFVSMLVFAMRGQKGVAILNELNGLVAEMQLTMTSNKACKNALTGQDPTVGNEIVFHDSAGLAVLAEKNKKFSGWKIDSVKFTAVSNLTHPVGPEALEDRFLGRLSVSATRNEEQAVGGAMKAQAIPVIFTRTGIGGPIKNCGLKGFLEIIDGPRVHGNLKINGGTPCPEPGTRGKCMTIQSQCPPGFRVHKCGGCMDPSPMGPGVPCPDPNNIWTFHEFHGFGATSAIGMSIEKNVDTCILKVYANFPMDTNLADPSINFYNHWEGIGFLLAAQCINAGY